jgi:hypothetical protein
MFLLHSFIDGISRRLLDDDGAQRISVATPLRPSKKYARQKFPKNSRTMKRGPSLSMMKVLASFLAVSGAWSFQTRHTFCRTATTYTRFSAKDQGDLTTIGVDSKKTVSLELEQILEEVRELQSPLTASPPTPTESLNVLLGQANNKLVNIALLGVATLGMAAYWNSMFLDFEWMQAWRYTWPCVGLLFMYEGGSSLVQDFGLVSPPQKTSLGVHKQVDNEISVTELASETISLQSDRPVWLRVVAILAGASLVIGGAADAFLPVYVTGPEFLTKAGLAPDAAALLASYQAVVLMGRVWSDSKINLTICGAHVLLLSQLLVLGAGSFDDVATLFTENLNPM